MAGSEWAFAWASVPEDRSGWAWAVLLSWVVAARPVLIVLFLLPWLLHGLLVTAVSKNRRLRVALTAGLLWLVRREWLHGFHLFWLIGGRSLLHNIVAHAGKEELPALFDFSDILCDVSLHFCGINKFYFRDKPTWMQAVLELICGDGVTCPICDQCDPTYLHFHVIPRMDYWIHPSFLDWELSWVKEDASLTTLWAAWMWHVYSTIRSTGGQSARLARFDADLQVLEKSNGNLPEPIFKAVMTNLPSLLFPDAAADFQRLVNFALRTLRPDAREENWGGALVALGSASEHLSSAQVDALLDALPSLIRRRPNVVQQVMRLSHTPLVRLLREKMHTRPELRESIIWSLRVYGTDIGDAWVEFFDPSHFQDMIPDLDLWVADGIASLWVNGLRSHWLEFRPTMGNIPRLHMVHVKEFVGEGRGSELRAFLYRHSGAAALLDAHYDGLARHTHQGDDERLLAANALADILTFWAWLSDSHRPSTLAAWAAKAPRGRLTLSLRG